MTVNWVLNAAGLFATTVAALLMFLHLRSLPRTVEELQTPEGRQAYAKYQRQGPIAVGLLAAWLVLQCLALILL
jgi:hypothetical protein